MEEIVQMGLLALPVIAIQVLLELTVKLTLMIVSLHLVIMDSALMALTPSFVFVILVTKDFFAKRRSMNALAILVSMVVYVKILLMAINAAVELVHLVQTVNTTLMNVPVIHVEMEQFVLMALILIAASVSQDIQVCIVKPISMNVQVTLVQMEEFVRI
jgi:hypothetical protein